MTKFLVRLAVNAVAIWLAARWIDGISMSTDTIDILLISFIFGISNAVIKPFITLFSLPFIVLTLGLFTLVVNGVILYLTAWFTDYLFINSFGAAFLGALVVSIVSTVLNSVLGTKNGD